MDEDSATDDDADLQSYRRLRQAAVHDMARARGDEEAIKAAITTYLRDGLSDTQTYHSPAALTDYFCVDSPSILDDAGYTEAEGDQATVLFDQIMPVIFQELNPAD
jgi:hypothetical protein